MIILKEVSLFFSLLTIIAFIPSLSMHDLEVVRVHIHCFINGYPSYFDKVKSFFLKEIVVVNAMTCYTNITTKDYLGLYHCEYGGYVGSKTNYGSN